MALTVLPLDHRPHHDGSPAHVEVAAGQPLPAPALGDQVAVRLEVPHAAGIDRVHVRTVCDGEPEVHAARHLVTDGGADLYEATVTVANPVTRYRWLVDGPGGTGWVTQLGLVEHDVADTHDFRLVASPPPPSWVADAVLYQVFPDRFARAGASDDWPVWSQPAGWDEAVEATYPASMRQLYGGDLPGIVDRVDHLVELGVTGIYLNPIFPAPENHRYCAASFAEVDPFLGGDTALAALTAALHDRGLTVIGDLTLNHSGDTHPWFQRAIADPDSVEAGFYHWIEYPHRYHSWAGVPTLPKFDHRDPQLRQRLYEGPGSVAARYLAAPFHLDGWRIDAANMAGRCGDVDVSQQVQETLLTTARDTRDDAYLLAEHCHDATEDLQGLGWHGTMDYTGFTRPAWSWLRADDVEVDLLGLPVPVPQRRGADVVRTITEVRGQLPWRSQVASLTPLGSHDTSRWAHVTGDRDRRHVGIAWQLTFPGVPSVQWGDELGLAAADAEAGRIPMPWDQPDRWDHDTLAWTRRLIALRRGHVALRHGGLRWLHIDDDHLLFLRPHPDERVLVQLTRAGAPAVQLDARALRLTAGEPLLDHGAIGDAEARHLTVPAADAPTARVWRFPGPAR